MLKVNRESILVTLMLLAILIAVFYFGDSWFVRPLRQEANAISTEVQAEQDQLEEYPPTNEALAQYRVASETTQEYLPIGAQANEALVILDNLANGANVSIVSMVRNSAFETVEDLPNGFFKNNYTAQLSSDNPENFRQLVNLLMAEERVWDVTSFGYSKSGEAYVSTISFDLYFYSDSVEATEETSETEDTESAETTSESQE